MSIGSTPGTADPPTLVEPFRSAPVAAREIGFAAVAVGPALLPADAFLLLAQPPAPLFVRLGLAGGEDVHRAGCGPDRQGCDVDGGLGDAAGKSEAQNGGHRRPDPRIDHRVAAIARAAAPGSSALVIGRPTTRMEAPLSRASRGVTTRFWSPLRTPPGRTPGTTK